MTRVEKFVHNATTALLLLGFAVALGYTACSTFTYVKAADAPLLIHG